MELQSDNKEIGDLAGAARPGPVPDLARTDGQSLALAMIDAWPEPAWIVDAGGVVAAVNTKGATLRIQSAIAGLAGECRDLGRSLMRRFSVESVTDPGRMTMEVTAVPVSGDDDGAVIMLAHDVTMDHHLTDALVASRELYRDLMQCSGDFAWETNVAGTFTYISVRSALGFSAGDMLGRAAMDLVPPGLANLRPLPFTSATEVEDAEVWLRSADGGERCLSVNAMPILDDTGAWTGARGVCRDVTAEHAQRSALTRLRERERLFESVIEAMRSAPEPSAMLALAVREMASAVDCRVILLRRNETGLWYAADGAAGDGGADAADLLGREIELFDPGRVLDYVLNGERFLCHATRFGDHINGALVFARQGTSGTFPAISASLMEALAGPLGIAIAQADQIERLQQLSSMDELTGLLNRRAFADAAKRRMAMGRRRERPAVFLYMDLDNFKPINDILGHQAGDKLLRRLGQLLLRSTRANDLVVRLGGDEFGIWLDAADLDGAIIKAESLIRSVPTLAPQLPSDVQSLGVSIGVTQIQPGDETIVEVLARADLALYEAKRAGRGRWAVAPAAPG